MLGDYLSSQNNLVWKGLLDLVWFKPLLQAGPASKPDGVAHDLSSSVWNIFKEKIIL